MKKDLYSWSCCWFGGCWKHLQNIHLHKRDCPVKEIKKEKPTGQLTSKQYHYFDALSWCYFPPVEVEQVKLQPTNGQPWLLPFTFFGLTN